VAAGASRDNSHSARNRRRGSGKQPHRQRYVSSSVGGPSYIDSDGCLLAAHCTVSVRFVENVMVERGVELAFFWMRRS
jgi:hypothetical protein